MANRFPGNNGDQESTSSSSTDEDEFEALNSLNDGIMAQMMNALGGGGPAGGGDGNSNSGKGLGFNFTIFNLSYTSQLQKKNPYDLSDMSNRVEVPGFPRGDGTSIPMLVPKEVRHRGHGDPRTDQLDIKTVVKVADLIYDRMKETEGFRLGYSQESSLDRKLDKNTGLVDLREDAILTFNMTKVQDWLCGYDVLDRMEFMDVDQNDGDDDDYEDLDGKTEQETEVLGALIVRRCQILCNKADPTTDYEMILSDLRMTEKLDLISSKVAFLMYYLMTICYRKLGRVDEAAKTLEKAEELLKDPFEPKDLYKKYKDKVAVGKRALELPAGVQPKKVPIDPPLQECNAKIPSLSAKVEVRKSKNKNGIIKDDQGRGVFAVKKILPGEIICVEKKPMFSMLDVHNKEVALSHCYHCLKATPHLIPCRTCPEVMFCSSKCEKEAVRTYHTHEEEGNGLCYAVKNSDPGIAEEILFALKILYSFKPNEIKEKTFNERLLKGTTYEPNNLPNPFVSDDKSNLLRLDINKGRLKEDVANLKKWRAICGLAFAHKLAKLSDWNDSDAGKVISEALMAKALLHIRRVVKLNTFVLKEMKEKCFAKGKKLPFGAAKKDERYIGMAIYAGASMFNHSCFKNASYFFTDGGGIVVVANDIILPGEEIFISYPFCAAAEKKCEERQETLDYMGIACDCPLCCYEITSNGDKWDGMLKGSNLMPLLIKVDNIFNYTGQHRDLIRLMEEIKTIMDGAPCRGMKGRQHRACTCPFPRTFAIKHLADRIVRARQLLHCCVVE